MIARDEWIRVTSTEMLSEGAVVRYQIGNRKTGRITEIGDDWLSVVDPWTGENMGRWKYPVLIATGVLKIHREDVEDEWYENSRA